MKYAIDTLTLGTLLKWCGALALLGALLWYGFFQARALIEGPILAVDEAVAATHDERMVTVTGTARNVTAVTLNDRPISTDESGRFSVRLVLENGYTIMTLRAEDRYGRHVTVAQPFVYAPAYEHGS